MSWLELLLVVCCLIFFATPDGHWCGSVGGGGIGEHVSRKGGAGRAGHLAPLVVTGGEYTGSSV